MSAACELDRCDLAILAVLQDDAALAVAQVAERVNLSQNACWRRIKRLEEEGFILRRVAILNAARLRAGLSAFVELKALERTDEAIEALASAVRRLPEVVECHRLSGDVDFLLKIQAEDIAAFDRVCKRLIRAVRMTDIRVSFSVETLKATTAIPLPNPA